MTSSVRRVVPPKVCMAISIMPETGSFAIPFGLVATLNKRAEQESPME